VVHSRALDSLGEVIYKRVLKNVDIRKELVRDGITDLAVYSSSKSEV
jgi:hypothetical protein